MRLKILGSATSIGVPVVGCRCEVCISDDPKNMRTRASVIIEDKGRTLLIDTSTDLRFQSLWYNVDRVDAVAFTHTHADHTNGIDDLRVFNFRQGGAIPIYGSKETIDEIHRRFSYIFEKTQEGGGKPMIDLEIVDGPFEAAGMKVTPIPLIHGEMKIYGFRVGGIAYCTDVNFIPNESYVLLKDLDVLVLDALRYAPHPTHFSLEQAVDAVFKIKPKRAVLTHLTHTFDYHTLAADLPPGIEPAYDGMVIDL